jgi:hypothetical protein
MKTPSLTEAISQIETLLHALPIGTVLDELKRAELVEKVKRIGRGEPLRAEGSGYADVEGETASFYPAPAGPYPIPPPRPAAPGGEED